MVRKSGTSRRGSRTQRFSWLDIISNSTRDVYLCGRTQRSAPTQRICFNESHMGYVNRFDTFTKPNTTKHRNAMHGGLRSGWAASRTGQLSDTESQLTFGGWQGGHRPRWPFPTSTTTFQRAAIGDGRPTAPASVTA